MRKSPNGGASRMRRGGQSVLELLIATALGTLLIGNAVLLYRVQREASTLAADQASIRDAGMTALVMLAQQIEMAGFTPVAPSGDDAANRDHARGALLGIFGCDAGIPSRGPGAFHCERRSRGSDSIVVGYVDDGVSTWQTASSRATDCLGHGIGAARARVAVVNVFYASQDDRREPQLYCRGNGSRQPTIDGIDRGNAAKQPVVAGVERVNMRYWLRGATTPLKAGAVAAHEWSDVVAVDLCVVVRGARIVSTRDYVDCDGISVPIRDRRARAVFSRRVAVRNNERDGGYP